MSFRNHDALASNHIFVTHVMEPWENLLNSLSLISLNSKIGVIVPTQEMRNFVTCQASSWHSWNVSFLSFPLQKPQGVRTVVVAPRSSSGLPEVLLASVFHRRYGRAMTHHSLWVPCLLCWLARVLSPVFRCPLHTRHYAGHCGGIKDAQCESVGDRHSSTCSSRCSDTQGSFSCANLRVLSHRS